MNLLKYTLIFTFTFFSIVSSDAQKKTIVKFTSTDNVSITGDVYLTEDINAPFILLFHQAMFSRGEYNEIAPKLNKLGYNCIAIDQRSGSAVNNVKNETSKDAAAKGKKTKYKDAFPDLQATFNYIKQEYRPGKIIIWGSSYSASLVFVLAAKNSDINAILAFSPGEYFEYEDKKISEWASESECPVFITSSKKEYDDCKLIFDKIKNKESVQFKPDQNGFHGSKALWNSKKGNDLYWKEVIDFLKNLQLN